MSTVQPIVLPGYFNDAFFSNLESLGNANAKILSTKIATENGDNFASTIYRTNIELDNNEQKSLIVKSFPEDAFSEEFAKKFNTFPKEMETYQRIIPEFEKIFEMYGEKISFAPICFKCSDNPHVIVMEDLTQSDFKMADKSGLDMTHMTRVLEKLAKFHAVSAVYKENYGDFSERYSRGMYNSEMKQIFDQYYDTAFGFMIEVLSDWPHSQESIQKMKRWKEHILNELISCMDAKKGSLNFSVLCHGDFWTNNILFKYDEQGNIEDLKFVDFQMSVYSSPSIDLNYFIFTSANSDIKLKEYDFFIKYYHEHLVKALKFFHYTQPIPTLKQLQIDMLDRGFYGVMACFSILPMCLLDKTVETSQEDFVGGDDRSKAFKRKLFNNPKFLDDMKENFKFFNCRGLLDLQ